MSNIIKKEQRENLVKLLNKLIETISTMRKEKDTFLLKMNEEEAKEWLKFLKGHYYKSELKSLEDEISDRLFYKFDISIYESNLDHERVKLMRKYLIMSNEYLK